MLGCGVLFALAVLHLAGLSPWPPAWQPWPILAQLWLAAALLLDASADAWRMHRRHAQRPPCHFLPRE